jgi:hypothetical protein
MLSGPLLLIWTEQIILIWHRLTGGVSRDENPKFVVDFSRDTLTHFPFPELRHIPLFPLIHDVRSPR